MAKEDEDAVAVAAVVEIGKQQQQRLPNNSVVGKEQVCAMVYDVLVRICGRELVPPLTAQQRPLLSRSSGYDDGDGEQQASGRDDDDDKN